MISATSELAARIALLVDRELAADAVEIWTLYWHARHIMEDELDDSQRSVAAEAALRGLIHEGVRFGELDDQTGAFRLIPDTDLADQIISRIRGLGRTPNMGDIGWLVKDVYP